MTTRNQARVNSERGGATMCCPTCGHISRVLETRREGNGTWRRRQCTNRSCAFEFATRESPREVSPASDAGV
jgi:hypothetical protein